MGKDLVTIVPDWRKAGVIPLQTEWPHEQPWHDYQLLPGPRWCAHGPNEERQRHLRLRRSHPKEVVALELRPEGLALWRFHQLPRLAVAAASPKLIEAPS